MIDKFQKFTSGDDNFIRTNDLAKEINRIIGYINKQEELAASTGNSSRITPNNGGTPLIQQSELTLDEVIEITEKYYDENHTKFTERSYFQISEILDYLREQKRLKDNPVPSLVKFIKIYEDHLTKASEGHDPYLLKKELFEELNLNGRETDKEQPK